MTSQITALGFNLDSLEMKFLIDAAHQGQLAKNFLDRKASAVMNILEQMERRDRGFQEVLE